MKIIIVSRSWPSNESSGVTKVAFDHAMTLVKAGHEVLIVGSHHAVINEKIPHATKVFIPATGSGSLYSPVRIDINLIFKTFDNFKPDLIIIEAWQTAITETSIDVAHQMGIPILMVSHGISVHSFSNYFIDRMRAVGWLYYRYFILPKRIKKVTLITALNLTSISHRFYDRDLAFRLLVPVIELVNKPQNVISNFFERHCREYKLVMIGYYSRVKNQILAIKLMKELPSNIHLVLIGPKSGLYYEKCNSIATSLGLKSRIKFLDQNECSISKEIATALAVLSTSITEALPITLLEAMSAGTPFIARQVGAIPSLRGGLFAKTQEEFRVAILELLSNTKLWEEKSLSGRLQIKSTFKADTINDALLRAVNEALVISKIRNRLD